MKEFKEDTKKWKDILEFQSKMVTLEDPELTLSHVHTKYTATHA